MPRKPFLSTQEHVFTTDGHRWETLKPSARQYRTHPTPAEDQLWQVLRGGQLGMRFRRQHAVGPFVVDFVCLSAGLVVEADGAVHGEAGQAAYDASRTEELARLGFRVLRFPDKEIMNNLPDVLRQVRVHLAPGAQTLTP